MAAYNWTSAALIRYLGTDLHPEAIIVDTSGSTNIIYISEPSKNRISVLSENGTILSQFPTATCPLSIFGFNGKIFVTNSQGSGVTEFVISNKSFFFLILQKNEIDTI